MVTAIKIASIVLRLIIIVKEKKMKVKWPYNISKSANNGITNDDVKPAIKKIKYTIIMLVLKNLDNYDLKYIISQLI